ncbi:PIG-L deacetylase family protein [Burkholderia sp. 8Y]|uniref:PIG-L deacetylase family protein n=1 Tax=Burkholderia sp. 8Y TaxID=2653133 RepID=UPI001F345165|nr:PIG-L family deacetylase [Burkholderia sp. 8Y]
MRAFFDDQLTLGVGAGPHRSIRRNDDLPQNRTGDSRFAGLAAPSASDRTTSGWAVRDVNSHGDAPRNIIHPRIGPRFRYQAAASVAGALLAFERAVILSDRALMIEVPLRTLLISPHLDDAVLGCGASLAGASDVLVCTVFTGCPAADAHTDWDAQCGFPDARQAMPARIEEDNRALGLLGATPLHLGFLDSQYVPFAADADKPTRGALTRAFLDAIDTYRPNALMIPLGLFHSDHALVHEAACDAWLRHADLPCIAYEEALYRCKRALLQKRLADLLERGIEATPLNARLPDHAEAQRREALKREAVNAYPSQLKAFGPDGYGDVFLPERFWTLEPAETRA